jgi:hypothetical protein
MRYLPPVVFRLHLGACVGCNDVRVVPKGAVIVQGESTEVVRVPGKCPTCGADDRVRIQDPVKLK